MSTSEKVIYFILAVVPALIQFAIYKLAYGISGSDLLADLAAAFVLILELVIVIRVSKNNLKYRFFFSALIIALTLCGLTFYLWNEHLEGIWELGRNK